LSSVELDTAGSRIEAELSRRQGKWSSSTKKYLPLTEDRFGKHGYLEKPVETKSYTMSRARSRTVMAVAQEKDKTKASETGTLKVDEMGVELFWRRYDPLEGIPKATLLLVNGTNNCTNILLYRFW
jgi:hypothetical protein